MGSHDPPEERNRARVRHHGRGLVVGMPTGTREGVVDSWIDVDLGRSIAGERRLYLLARRLGRELVFGREVQHQRAFYARHKVEHLLDADTVVADRAIDAAM